jgi:hypothetical protein
VVKNFNEEIMLMVSYNNQDVKHRRQTNSCASRVNPITNSMEMYWDKKIRSTTRIGLTTRKPVLMPLFASYDNLGLGAMAFWGL